MTTQRYDIDGMCKKIAEQQNEIASLKAQVDALYGALHHLEKEGWLSHIKQLAYRAPDDLRYDIFGGIDRCRDALAATGL